VFTEAGIDRLESRLLLMTALASKDVGKPIAANQITIDPPSPFGIHPKTIRFDDAFGRSVTLAKALCEQSVSMRLALAP